MLALSFAMLAGSAMELKLLKAAFNHCLVVFKVKMHPAPIP
jgi:hypothetical protein